MVLEFFVILLAIIPITYFFWDRFRRPSLELDINPKNVFVCKFYWPDHRADGADCVVFHDIAILNLGQRPVTLKDLRVSYPAGMPHISDRVISMLVHEDDNPFGGGVSHSVVATKGHTHIILGGWKNFPVAIREKGALSNGEIVRFSAVFFLPEGFKPDLEGGNFIDIIIETFGSKPAKSTVCLERQAFETGDGLFVRRELPNVDENGNFDIQAL